MKRFELLENEEILIEEPIHWKNMIFPAITVVLVTLLFLLRMRFWEFNLINITLRKVLFGVPFQHVASPIEVLLLLVIITVAFAKIIRIQYIRYYVTTKRIISIGGVFNVTFAEMLIARCEMVYLNQTAYEQMFNSGDILCVSAGAQLFLDDVKDARKFKQTILSIMQK